MLGGALAQPSQSFPTLFPPGSLFDRFPFLLPNLVCTFILVLGVLVGILFLEETHETKKHRRDIGIETGRWLQHCLNPKAEPVAVKTTAKGHIEDEENLLEDEAPPGYRTTEGSPRQPSSRLQSPNVVPTDLRFGIRRNGLNDRQLRTSAFTRQVILNIIGFGLLA